jgi:hypothetical protein
MSTLEDVKDLFGQLTTTSLTNLLQSIDIAGGTDSLSGLIVDGADYQTVYGHPFDPLLLLMAAYDPNIPSDATDSVWVKAEKEWSFKADRQCLICATEHLRFKIPEKFLPVHRVRNLPEIGTCSCKVRSSDKKTPEFFVQIEVDQVQFS